MCRSGRRARSAVHELCKPVVCSWPDCACPGLQLRGLRLPKILLPHSIKLRCGSPKLDLTASSPLGHPDQVCPGPGHVLLQFFIKLPAGQRHGDLLSPTAPQSGGSEPAASDTRVETQTHELSSETKASWETALTSMVGSPNPPKNGLEKRSSGGQQPWRDERPLAPARDSLQPQAELKMFALQRTGPGFCAAYRGWACKVTTPVRKSLLH